MITNSSKRLVIFAILIAIIGSSTPINSLNATVSLTYISGGTFSNSGEIMVLGPFGSAIFSRTVISTGSSGFEWLSISNTNTINLVNSKNPGTPYLGFDYQDNFVYLTKGVQGIDIIRINSGGTFNSLGSYSMVGDSKDLAVMNGIAYVASSTGGLYALNITIPSSVNVLDNYASYNPVAIEAEGNSAYLAAGIDGVIITDIRVPTTIKFSKRIDTLGSADNLFLQNQYLFVADNGANGEGLVIMDISDPGTAKKVSNFTIPNVIKDIFVYGPYAFLSLGAFGLRVIDVSDILNPREVGKYLSKVSNSVYVDGEFVYNSYLGVYVLKWDINPVTEVVSITEKTTETKTETTTKIETTTSVGSGSSMDTVTITSTVSGGTAGTVTKTITESAEAPVGSNNIIIITMISLILLPIIRKKILKL